MFLGTTTSFQFQPTPSARRVTLSAVMPGPPLSISTHTLRKEGDINTAAINANIDAFQPTPSARRVTQSMTAALQRMTISTHTLRKEGDAKTCRPGVGMHKF